MIKQFNSLLDLLKTFSDEQSCIDHFTAIKWSEKKQCPHCGGSKIYHFSDNRTHKCGDCRKKFSIRVGTIFEDSKIPLQKWFMAIYLTTSHKKGISSIQLSKDIDVTQKTAWFMLHRVRLALQDNATGGKLSGEVEVDESFIGGAARNMHAGKRAEKIKGRGPEGKAIVAAVLERGGKVRAKVVETRKKATLQKLVRDNVAPGSSLYSDALKSYDGLGEDYTHQVIDHAEAYVDGQIHTNGLENFWSLRVNAIPS